MDKKLNYYEYQGKRIEFHQIFDEDLDTEHFRDLANHQAMEIRKEIESDPGLLLKYAMEEYKKAVGNYGNQDYSNTFILAATVSMKLIHGRVVSLKEYIQYIADETENAETNIDNYLFNNSVQRLIYILVKNNKKEMRLVITDDEVNQKIGRFKTLLPDLSKLIIIRNNYIHSYLHVSRQLAKKSIDILERNINEFKDWVNTDKQ